MNSRKIARSLPNRNLHSRNKYFGSAFFTAQPWCYSKRPVPNETTYKVFIDVLRHSLPVFEKRATHWPKRFMKWLSEEIVFSTVQGQEALSLLVSSATRQRKFLLEATRKIRELSRTSDYEEPLRLIRAVPGVGFITEMTFLTEIESISRFTNSDKLAGYIGLIPTSHTSGEKEGKGEMTFRGQAQMKSMLIESSWFAARIDPAKELNGNMPELRAMEMMCFNTII